MIKINVSFFFSIENPKRVRSSNETRAFFLNSWGSIKKIKVCLFLLVLICYTEMLNSCY